MLSFIRMIFMILVFGLISTVALGHLEDPRDWGYIRINNRAAVVIKTNCYDEGGGSQGWRTTYARQFRSCHGDYMRMDVVSGNTLRFYRKTYHCGDKGLYITISGHNNDIQKKVECK